MKKIFTILGMSAAFMMNAQLASQIVISEVYGGGGSTTPLYINDYVELKNVSNTTATLSNATLQYASATGNFNSYAVLPSITLNPGQKYLIEMIAAIPNTSGTALPTADHQIINNISFSNGNTYNGGFNMSGVSGKVALVNSTIQATSPTSQGVIDFVGYGAANAYEGIGAAPSLDVNSSATRPAGDTNDNAADFVKATPTPENTTALSVSDVNGSKVKLVKNTIVNNAIVFGAKANVNIVNANGQVVKSAAVTEGTSLDVSSLNKGMYIITGDVNGQTVSQKIIKQ